MTAIRVCYPKGFCKEHAKVHAAACASVAGTVSSIWACQAGAVRTGNPAIGLELQTPLAAARMRGQQLPAVQGSPITVHPWEGSRTSHPDPSTRKSPHVSYPMSWFQVDRRLGCLTSMSQHKAVGAVHPKACLAVKSSEGPTLLLGVRACTPDTVAPHADLLAVLIQMSAIHA